MESLIRTLVADAPDDAVMTIRVTGPITESVSEVLSAAFLRSLTPTSMNLDLRLADRSPVVERSNAARQDEEWLELGL